MVVGEQDQVDGGQVIESEAGREEAAGTEPAEGRGAVAEDRIGQQVDAGQLDQKGCVSDPGDAQLGRCTTIGGQSRHSGLGRSARDPFRRRVR